MAIAPHIRPAPFGSLIAYRAVRAVEALTEAYRRSTRRFEEVDRIANLKDRDLNDTGLTRSDRLAPRYSMFAARAL